MNLALHDGPWLWHAEKWYVDLITPAGDYLIVVMAGVRIAGLWRGRVTADLYRADGTTVGGGVTAAAASGGENRLTFGTSRITGDRFQFETPGLSGDLTFVSRFPPAMPRDPLFAAGGRTVRFAIEVPDADVTGALRWPGAGVLDVAGSRGYRDRWWTGILPWRLPMRRVHWGRAVAGRYASSWMHADTVDGAVRMGWEAGAAGEPAPPPLADERLVYASRVADLPSLRGGALATVLRWFADPHQSRWVAHAALHGEAGWAVRELVVWR